ncbi:MAG: hypothetical protein QME66_13600, partial [Candidatus Eisenbacteria bacterium]|nr:hypothetical protein [Candidatus Eisenbacteria bacterium]
SIQQARLYVKILMTHYTSTLKVLKGGGVGDRENQTSPSGVVDWETKLVLIVFLKLVPPGMQGGFSP